jgi:carboxyl-terminal processing protease
MITARSLLQKCSFPKTSCPLVSLKKAQSEKGLMKGLVLDLRNNPGGLLTEAAWVADAFLESGLIVYTDGRMQSQNQRYFARKEGSWAGFPMVVLVNERSAAGSELVAGALQDWGRALVLGTCTTGRGWIQNLVSLSDGLRLHSLQLGS